MFVLDPAIDSPSFEIIGSNVSQVATFGSDTSSSFLKIYANDPGSNVGFLLGTSNVSSNIPSFSIGQIGLDGSAGCNIIIVNNYVGIGTANPEYTLHIEGKMYAADSITSYSDIAVKTNVYTITDALHKVESIRGVQYTRKDTGEQQIGVIAQEVQQVIPEVVANTANGLSVAYGNMVGLLIEAVKELKLQVNTLQDDIHTLKLQQMQL